jgi:transposase
VYIEIRPRRFQCPDCAGKLTTTQRLSWYEENSPHTKAFDQWLLKMLIDATVAAASRRCGVGYDAVEGALARGVLTAVDWERFETLETLGIEEIALKKGHKHYVAVVSCRDADGQIAVLGVLPDRLKATVVAFLAAIPDRLKATIEQVCTDIYDGYIQAAREVLPEAEIVIDRFHVAKNYHEGVDRLRQQEMRRLKEELPESAYDELKGLMWVYRRHWWDLDDEQRGRLALLFGYSPALPEAYFLRHRLTLIFEATDTKAQALAYLDLWQTNVVASGLRCFDAFITTLGNWRDEICNYFNARHSSGFVEGMNNKLKVIKRRCYGLLDPVCLFQRIQLDLEGEEAFV